MITKHYQPEYIVITDDAHKEIKIETFDSDMTIPEYIGALVMVGLEHRDETTAMMEELDDE